ncbi:Response regulator receiver domain-containing protein [Hymenobacter gelipurpurascens]|uniref:Response regulator receiver domain-containing protein n=1 Tax=Hymenobacter gelipurpurascens TaxID=89968 RepID=A0A212TA57_9BACT|nr:response regulator [Hymenobacter gelipurpurascens]SNC62740.1 Response regulator receiver domain-containing protein [Hymenobacter gelipurpurascens]
MKILVVDDEMDVRTLFEQRFRREIRSGLFSFSFAYSGEEALAYLREHASEVVLILSDINMPGMSGLELLKHIKQQYLAPPPTPPQVMMITAYSDDDSYKEAMQLGANDFLTKPVDFAALKEKLTLLASHEN